ncbi:uncharacterized protein SPPG_08286 [Spizellomyces punctatus DAOM BR117]|uniref:VASt domain-containing protein n=1 Tax=Spizellomyces punctatus (strain DAOM BR117) TaxID=645134 RepID=A0A0L0H586_SPIPD|nr:uncharacterized protein SPPG_08286 [Spizellomyces punctatus DAOM BR117]KNC96387.1 hypothetical protein SPPG_08286 [Spizellomyces punctatus DAOM BR117]|eukprot:XP_016604427.1 hypothetical protein SPPG_08286 [Spizellomyces punctatus DAOM BR117]
MEKTVQSQPTKNRRESTAMPSLAVTPSTPLPQKNADVNLFEKGSNSSLESFASARSSEEMPHSPTGHATACRKFRKSRSDNSLKEGIKATAHAVREVAHVAKEALKEAVVNPIRVSMASGDGQSIPATVGAATFAEEVNRSTFSSTMPEPDVPEGLKSLPRKASTVTSFNAPANTHRQSMSIPDEATNRRLGRTISKRGSKPSIATSTRDVKKFVKLFPELTTNAEGLMTTYTCALERDVLWHGKLYFTDVHLCFYGKLFAKSTKIVVNFREVTGIEKKNTAGMFPNAIRITVDQDTKYVFSSFLKRDAAYEDLIHLWRNTVSPLSADERAMLGLVHGQRGSSRESEGQSQSDGALSDHDDGSISPRSAPAVLEVIPNLPYDDSRASEVANQSEDAVAAHSGAATPERYRSQMPPTDVSEVREKLVTPSGFASASHLGNDHSSQHIHSGMRTSTSDTNLLRRADPAPTPAGALTRQGRALTIASGLEFIRRILPKYGEDGEGEGVEPSDQLLAHEAPSVAGAVLVSAPNISNEAQNTSSAMQTPAFSKAASSLGLQDTGSTSISKAIANGAAAAAAVPTSGAGQSPAAAEGKDKEKTLSVQRPSQAMSCNCETHLDSEIADVTLDLDVEVVFDAIFCKEGSEIVRETHRRRETEDVKFGEWGMDAQGHFTTREITYTVSFKPPMLAKQTTGSFEKQTVLRQDPLVAYVVECAVRTPKAPYGEYFTLMSRYCITHAGPGKTRLRITSKVDFNKRVMWKAQIENATIDGMKQFSAELVNLIRKIGARAKAGDLGSASRASESSGVDSSQARKNSLRNGPISDQGDQVTSSVNGEGGAEQSLYARVRRIVARTVVALFPSVFSTPNPPPLGTDHRGAYRISTGPTREERRAALMLVLLLFMLVMGLVATVMNVFWVVDIGRRLDRTLTGIEKVKILGDVDLGAFGRFRDHEVKREPEVNRDPRAILLHKTHSQLAHMRTTLHEAQRRAGALEDRLRSIGSNIAGAVHEIGGIVQGEYEKSPDGLFTESSKPFKDPLPSRSPKEVRDGGQQSDRTHASRAARILAALLDSDEAEFDNSNGDDEDLQQELARIVSRAVAGKDKVRGNKEKVERTRRDAQVGAVEDEQDVGRDALPDEVAADATDATTST